MKTSKLEQLRKLADEFVETTLGADMEIMSIDPIHSDNEFAIGYRNGTSAYFYCELKEVPEEDIDGKLTYTPTVFICIGFAYFSEGEWKDDIGKPILVLDPAMALQAAVAKIYADETALHFGLV